MALGRSNSLSINTGAASGSIFGNTNANSNNATAGTNPFGNTNTAQQPATNSIFGNRGTTQPAPATSSILGSSTTQQQPAASQFFGGNATQQQPATSNLFGGASTQQQQPAMSNLFGGNSTQQQQQTTSNLFGATDTAQQQQPSTTNIFGASILQQSTQPPSQNPFAQTLPHTSSLLGATLRAQQPPSYNRLSMGQAAGGVAPGGAPGSVSATKIDFDALRSTTRFEDCIDAIRDSLESVDRLVQNQENWARQVEAALPRHDADIASLAPDVDLIRDTADAAEQALALDAAAVQAQRDVVGRDRADVQRCERVVTNLALPRQYHFSGMQVYKLPPQTRGAAPGGGIEGAGGPGGSAGAGAGAPPSSSANALGGDTDLVGNYFVPLAGEMGSTMSQFAANLAEIEGHMRVIEASTHARMQNLAVRRAGAGAGGGGAGAPGADETVRELADTLRGFERGILDTASVVGECREGVNELLLGRLGDGHGRR